MHNKHAPWQSYWNETSNDTFGERFAEGNPIADALAPHISSLALVNQQFNCLLDLGCGKGQHFQWLRQVIPQTEKNGFDIIGIDAALPNTQLDAKTRIITDNFEALINVKQSGVMFEVVFALFAAEYANFTKLLSALKSATRQPLDCVFVMHTPDSVITEKSQKTLAFYKLLLNKSCEKALRKFKKCHDIKAFETTVLTVIHEIVNLKRPELMTDLQVVVTRLQRLFSEVNLQQKAWHVERFLHYFEQLKMHVLRLEQQLSAATNSELLRSELNKHEYEIKSDKTINNEFGEVARLIHFTLIP